MLEITGQILLVQPYFTNFGKRLLKSPKVHWGDSGLACHLLGITTQAELDRSPFLGALFEGFVAPEIVKHQLHQGRRKEIYHFRDQQGPEVGFLFPSAGGSLWMIACKASKTVLPGMAGPMSALRRAMGDTSPVRMTVVHRPPPRRRTPETSCRASRRCRCRNLSHRSPHGRRENRDPPATMRVYDSR